jgi:hypothetical protein
MTLHPALRNGGMQTLMDVVSEARLRKWAEDCQKGNGARSPPTARCSSSIHDC